MPGPDFSTAELIERKDVTNTLAIFRFRAAEPIRFVAGQYTTISIKCDGVLVERPYSIASSPYERSVEFFIELVPGGLFTPQLWKLGLGASILIRRRAVGRFTLDSSSDRHLMLATVTGVAPFISMLRTRRFDHERGVSTREQFLIIHGASCSAELGPYRNELEQLSAEGWLKYVPTISRPWEEPNWVGEIGRVEDIVRKHADQLGFSGVNSVAYTCGHPQMVETVKGILTRDRYLKRQIREEQYFALHHSDINNGRIEKTLNQLGQGNFSYNAPRNR
jgi:ferredoxin--NADP+ reductase